MRREDRNQVEPASLVQTVAADLSKTIKNNRLGLTTSRPSRYQFKENFKGRKIWA